jgi:hypothetical protein
VRLLERFLVNDGFVQTLYPVVPILDLPEVMTIREYSGDTPWSPWRSIGFEFVGYSFPFVQSVRYFRERLALGCLVKNLSNAS